MIAIKDTLNKYCNLFSTHFLLC